MNSGHLCCANRIKLGFGWHSAVKVGKWSQWRSVTAVSRAASACGMPSRKPIERRFVTAIFGLPMLRWCQRSAIGQLERRVGKPLISNASITRYGNDLVVWFGKPCRSQRTRICWSPAFNSCSTVTTRSALPSFSCEPLPKICIVLRNRSCVVTSASMISGFAAHSNALLHPPERILVSLLDCGSDSLRSFQLPSEELLNLVKIVPVLLA